MAFVSFQCAVGDKFCFLTSHDFLCMVQTDGNECIGHRENDSPRLVSMKLTDLAADQSLSGVVVHME